MMLGSSTPNATPGSLLKAADAVLARLLAEGTTAGLAAHAPLIDRALEIATAQGATWLVLALSALAAQIGAYEQRSALYDEDEVFGLATEIYARPRAREGAAMGFGEPMETTMAKTRLVALGARIVALGSELRATVALFDSDTGTPMLIEKVFAPGPHETRLPPDQILTRPLVPGLPLLGLARGQIITSVASRRADGTVGLGSGARGKTTLMPRAVAVTPPAPLFVSDLASLHNEFTGQPPAFLRARNRVSNMHVFAVDAVLGQTFDPGTQIWRAAITLPSDGGRLLLRRRYDAGAPSALDILNAAAAGAYGPIRQLAGQVWLENGELWCEPWSIAADTLIVPDVDNSKAAHHTGAASPAEPRNSPSATRSFVAGALHAGAGRRDMAFAKQGERLAQELEATGYGATGKRLEHWLRAPVRDHDAFGALATWLSVLLESTVR